MNFKRKHCPVCNGIIKPLIRTRDPGNIWYCPQCGYSGAFIVEWEDEEKMGSYAFQMVEENQQKNPKSRSDGSEHIIGLLIGFLITGTIFFILYLTQ
jgi:hypothetical protein